MNPRFEIQREKPALSRILNDEYLPYTTSSKRRMDLIKKLATNHETMKNIEDVGILSYMRRNGLEKESNKYDMAQTLIDFNKECEVHPVLQ